MSEIIVFPLDSELNGNIIWDTKDGRIIVEINGYISKSGFPVVPWAIPGMRELFFIATKEARA